jgi:hypothetical protein
VLKKPKIWLLHFKLRVRVFSSLQGIHSCQNLWNPRGTLFCYLSSKFRLNLTHFHPHHHSLFKEEFCWVSLQLGTCPPSFHSSKCVLIIFNGKRVNCISWMFDRYFFGVNHYYLAQHSEPNPLDVLDSSMHISCCCRSHLLWCQNTSN